MSQAVVVYDWKGGTRCQSFYGHSREVTKVTKSVVFQSDVLWLKPNKFRVLLSSNFGFGHMGSKEHPQDINHSVSSCVNILFWQGNPSKALIQNHANQEMFASAKPQMNIMQIYCSANCFDPVKHRRYSVVCCAWKVVSNGSGTFCNMMKAVCGALMNI